MRKVVCTLVMLLAVAAALTIVPVADAAGGGSGSGCTYRCDCAGNPLKCCPTTGGGTFCFPTDEIGCPQVYNC